MIAGGRHDIGAIGRYRDHDDAMQVVSGLPHKPRVHFEAPPSKAMAAEMKGFLAWFAATAPGGKQRLAALTRAGRFQGWPQRRQLHRHRRHLPRDRNARSAVTGRYWRPEADRCTEIDSLSSGFRVVKPESTKGGRR
jgi:hypothetical protein